MNAEFLGQLAELVTGKRVQVALLPASASEWGIATHDRTSYVIQLHPRLFGADREHLAFVFLHECGHIWRHVPKMGDNPLENWIAVVVRDYFDPHWYREMEADAFADVLLPLVESALPAGVTFNDVAII